ncbi:MAG: ribulose-phosphate 3-epimerase [Bryobacterales bacterium]|nr:ribulose-phosphate 3-epimerase [Bryobacterales bacterium]
MIQIQPSILSADFARLAFDIERVETAGVSMLHVDVMDGHFVPNISLGPPVLRSLRKATRLHLDTHLMIEDPDRYLQDFVDAGADSLSVHWEACRHLHRTLESIRKFGIPAGVVINPATPVRHLEEVLPMVDYVLVMSVNPGFGGQRFIPGALAKLEQLVAWRRELGLDFKIQIDGGISAENIAGVARAGADWIVAGSSVFGQKDPGGAVLDMRQRAHEALSVRV